MYDGTSWNISTKSKLFAKQNHFGDVATRKLASDLYIHVPLALYGSFSQTYPVCNKTEFKEQMTKIAAINNASDTSMMLADITVCWNAVKYFDPYLYDLNSDWNKELRKAVESTLSYTTYSSRPLKAMMAVLKDAHVMVNSPKDHIAPKAYLPIAVKKLDGKLFVAHSLNSTLVAGDEIESVNGENAIDTFEYFEQEISGHPRHNAVKAEQLWLRSFSDYDSVDINLKRDGKSIKVSTSPTSRENYIQKMSPYYLGGNSRWIKDNILFLNLRNTDFQTVSRLLFDRKDDTTVIIDTREGTQFHFATILPLLVDEESLIPFRDGISNIPCITTPDTPVIRDTLTDITHRTPNKKNRLNSQKVGWIGAKKGVIVKK